MSPQATASASTHSSDPQAWAGDTCSISTPRSAATKALHCPRATTSMSIPPSRAHLYSLSCCMPRAGCLTANCACRGHRWVATRILISSDSSTPSRNTPIPATPSAISTTAPSPTRISSRQKPTPLRWVWRRNSSTTASDSTSLITLRRVRTRSWVWPLRGHQVTPTA